jgi:uncharacterized membrane-anchored protein
MKKIALTASTLFLLPFVAFAQTGTLSNIRTLINNFGAIVQGLIPILIAATVVIFFWGLFQYVRGSGEDASKGKGIMIAGIAALFIELSIWGIIVFAQSSLGIQTNSQSQSQVSPPAVPLQNL